MPDFQKNTLALVMNIFVILKLGFVLFFCVFYSCNKKQQEEENCNVGLCVYLYKTEKIFFEETEGYRRYRVNFYLDVFNNSNDDIILSDITKIDGENQIDFVMVDRLDKDTIRLNPHGFNNMIIGSGKHMYPLVVLGDDLEFWKKLIKNQMYINELSVRCDLYYRLNKGNYVLVKRAL